MGLQRGPAHSAYSIRLCEQGQPSVWFQSIIYLNKSNVPKSLINGGNVLARFDLAVWLLESNCVRHNNWQAGWE